MGEYFEIEGRKYISSKRASEITGYAKDYIGQLSRGGKIEAKQIGRNWFIDESSLLLHKFGEAAPAKNSADTESVPEVVETFVAEAEAPVAPSKPEYVRTYVLPAVVHKGPAHEPRRVPNPLLLSSLSIRYYPSSVAYTQDDRPLFPEPARLAYQSAPVSLEERVVTHAIEENATPVLVSNTASAPRPRPAPSTATKIPAYETDKAVVDSSAGFMPSFGLLKASAALSIIVCSIGFSFATFFTERVMDARSVAASGVFSVESTYLMTFSE